MLQDVIATKHRIMLNIVKRQDQPTITPKIRTTLVRTNKAFWIKVILISRP